MLDAHTPAPGRAFAALGLPDALVETVVGIGFETPTEIQQAAIPALLSGRDVTGVARTGTGKTAAFGLPLVHSIDPEVRAVQALVLAPTRELGVQVADALTSFAADTAGIDVLAVYGGSPFWQQKRALDAGAQVVVGTPGRIMDHLNRGTLNLEAVHFVVLDEADEMLRMGFAEDVDTILQKVPTHRQTALFSATMPPAIRRVAQRHLNDPMDVTVAGTTTSTGAITQSYAVVPFPQRAEALARVLEISEGDAAIVFVRTKSACEDVAGALATRGIRASVLNGDVAQPDREKIVQRLRDGRVDVLVATDVAARGLDVDRIDLVVNFDAPADTETYVHRVGRTGRAQRTGRAVTFLSPRERYMVRQIERQTGSPLVQITPPTQREVFAHRSGVALAACGERIGRPRFDDYRAAIAAHVHTHGVDVADLAAALLARAAGDDGTWVEPPPRPERERAPRAERPPRGGRRQDRDRDGARGRRGTMYRLSVGRRNGARPANIVGAITGAGHLDGSDLGRIDVRDDHSLVEFMSEPNEATLRRISQARIGGRRLFMEQNRRGTGNRPAEARR